MSLDLLKRSEKGSALTHAEVDQNWTDIETAHNGLETRVDVTLNADGTLKANPVEYAATLVGTDSYAVTLDGTYATLADLAGKILLVKIDVSNTGPATLNPNALGATAIYRPGGLALRSGDLKQGIAQITLYVGGLTYFVLLNPGANSPANYGATTNSSNDYTITVTDLDTDSFEVPAAYYAGYTVKAKINALNSGASRLKIAATDPSIDLGFADIKKNAGTALIGGELQVGQIYEFVYDGTNFQIQTSQASNQIIQVVSATLTTTGSTTTTIPDDGTDASATDGLEILTCTITPKSAQSKLYVEAVTYLSNNGGNRVAAALFRDGTSKSVGAGVATCNAADMVTCIAKTIVDASAATSTTFKLNIGGSAGTTYYNRRSSQDTPFGTGVLMTTIEIREILPS